MSIIEENNNLVIVDGSYFIKHDYYLHRVPQLVESLYRLNISGKQIKIIFPDGEPIRYTGIEHLLSILSTEFGLKQTDLIIQTADRNFTSACATIEYIPSPFFHCCGQFMANWKEQQLDNTAVLFGATFGRYTLERFLLSAFLGTQHSSNSFIIFQPPVDVVKFEFDRLEDTFRQELDWFNNYTKPNLGLPSEHNGLVNWQAGCNDYSNIWSKYLIEIVVETDIHCKYWITDKTIRCLVTGKPFIAMAGPGFLTWLQELGFKTYNQLIDESYDRETRATVRLEMLKEEINKIADYTPAQLGLFMQGLNEITTYNKHQFFKISDRYYKNFN